MVVSTFVHLIWNVLPQHLHRNERDAICLAVMITTATPALSASAVHKYHIPSTPLSQLYTNAVLKSSKIPATSEVGVNRQSGYNDHLTSREAGSVGGQMVKKAVPYEP